ncbi:MAG: hypothetical protein AAGJ52_10305 [Pseudomonadota bacterium]
MNSSSLNTRLLPWILLGCGWWFPGSYSWAQSSEITQCAPKQAALFCQFRPDVSELPLLTQSDIDTASPATQEAWAIGGNSTITLPAGSSWSPGIPSSLFQPIIWVVDTAQLVIAGDSSSEVAIDASIILCDDAQLIVDNTALRINQDFTFEHLFWAADNSQVRWNNAEIFTGSTTAPTAQLLQFMRGNSVLRGTTSGSASLNLGNGPLWLQVLDSAVADISNSSGIFETTVTPSASLSMTDSSFISAGLTLCEGSTATLDDLPEACDLTSGCFSGSHPATTYSSAGAPGLSISNSQLFSWQFITLPSSTLNLTNADPDANTVVELTGELTETVQLPPDESPIGLTDRTINLTSTTLLGWSLSPLADSQLTVEADSELVNVTVAGASEVSISGSTLRRGRVEVIGGQLSIQDSVVEQETLNLATLNATRTLFNQTMTTGGDGRSFLADSPMALAPQIVGNGELFEVSLSSPASDITLSGQSIDIIGSVRARDSMGTLNPFPEAELELIPASTGVPALLATLSNPTEEAVLATLDSGPLTEGFYEIRLRFIEADDAASEREIQVAGPLIFRDRFRSETP